MRLRSEQAQIDKTRIIEFLENAPSPTLSVFSEFENEMIKKYYPEKGSKPLAEAFGKTQRQVMSRSLQMGVRRNK